MRTPDRYIELITSGKSPESSFENLDDQTRAIEALQLLLRTKEGVLSGAFAATDIEFMNGMLEPRGARLVLTRAGRLMANEVAIRLRVPAASS